MSNDQGYNSVLKEYDFYNSNDDEFEIIDEFPKNYISNIGEKNSNDKENIKEIINKKEKIKNFIIKIFKVIFNSRNKRSEFSSKSKRKLNNNKSVHNFFTVDIEELIEYDNLKAWDDSEGEKNKKYIIDFYLIKNDEKNKDSHKRVKNNDNQKIPVERWKIKYKEDLINNDNNKNIDLFLNKKMKLIEKNITSFSRILPLFNISKKDDKYEIDFKFNQKIKNTKKLFSDDELFNKIKISNNDIFSFKLSIYYLKINPDNIENLFNKFNNDFVIIPSQKSRRRFLSDDFHKKSSYQLLNNLEQKNNNEKNENENSNPSFIIEDYIKDRRLSFEINTIDNYINTIFKEQEKENLLNKKESVSDSNTGSDLSLVISEENTITRQNSNEKKNKKDFKIRKMTFDDNNINNKKEYIHKRHYTCNENSKNKKVKINFNNLKNFEFQNNSKIKIIIQDYKTVRKMIKMMPKYGNIKYNKLSTFITSN